MIAKPYARLRADMYEALPLYYHDMYISRNIIEQEAKEFERLTKWVAEIVDQANPATATWSIDRWERIFGIVPDPTKTIEQRRSVIISRLRGVGPVNIPLIESVAAAFNGAEVEAREDNPNYLVEIEFVNQLGIPARLDDVMTALRDLIPAHLDISFIFRYVTYGMLQGYNKTYGQVEARALTFGELETWGGT